MKKITSLLLTAVLLATMLTVFAVPASAAAESRTITGDCDIKNQTFFGSYVDSVFKIENNDDVNVLFENVTFENIRTGVYGDCLYINHPKANGGGITITFKNCRFINCGMLDESDGGCIYVDGSGSVIIDFYNCVAMGCQAENGGFLYSDNEKCYIDGHQSTLCYNCEASEYGGAVYLWNNEETNGITYVNNRADQGGAIYNQCVRGSHGFVNNSTFVHNTATDEGGALWSKTQRWTNASEVEWNQKVVEYVNYNNDHFFNNKDEDGYDIHVSKTLDHLISAPVPRIENSVFYTDNAKEINAEKPYECHVYNGIVGEEKDKILMTSSLTLTPDEDGVFHIGSTADWQAFQNDVMNQKNYSFKNRTVILDTDLAVQFPIGFWSDTKKDRPFAGIFDGNGHTLTIASPGDGGNAGVFAHTKGATIKNLTVNGALSGGWSLGGVVGCATDTVITDCDSYVYITGNGEDATYAGGMVGCSEGDLSLTNCRNFGNISSVNKTGGMVGAARKRTQITNCVNYGDVTSMYVALLSSIMKGTYAGGMIGCTEGDYARLYITNCINNGMILAFLNDAGGISGMTNEYGKIYNCINNGQINSTGCAGGLVGENSGEILNCYCDPAVKLMGANGLSGKIHGSNNSGKIDECYATDTSPDIFNDNIKNKVFGDDVDTSTWLSWTKEQNGKMRFAVANDGGIASILSSGSIWIIAAVAGIAVGFLAATLIFTKKKPATAGGENNDEE